MTSTKPIKIVAISGSLNSTSTNTTILSTLVKLVPGNVVIEIVDDLNTLPHFNPQTKKEIATVNNFRQKIKDSDAVIFSTPEYAFGVPGVLKNALDWLVFSGELNEKPVSAISASLYTYRRGKGTGIADTHSNRPRYKNERQFNA